MGFPLCLSFLLSSFFFLWGKGGGELTLGERLGAKERGWGLAQGIGGGEADRAFRCRRNSFGRLANAFGRNQRRPWDRSLDSETDRRSEERLRDRQEWKGMYSQREGHEAGKFGGPRARGNFQTDEGVWQRQWGEGESGQRAHPCIVAVPLMEGRELSARSRS
uniref:Uncharacterized protein n=1 Tax=Tetraselmis sp. GSL018 TaxID=582737 RepID=A0A061RGS0_9CHLO